MNCYCFGGLSSNPYYMNLVWKFSAPDILQRSPAPQPGALAPRAPSAPVPLSTLSLQGPISQADRRRIATTMEPCYVTVRGCKRQESPLPPARGQQRRYEKTPTACPAAREHWQAASQWSPGQQHETGSSSSCQYQIIRTKAPSIGERVGERERGRGREGRREGGREGGRESERE